MADVRAGVAGGANGSVTCAGASRRPSTRSPPTARAATDGRCRRRRRGGAGRRALATVPLARNLRNCRRKRAASRLPGRRRAAARVHRHRPVVGGAVDVGVDGVADRLPLLLRDVPEQAGRSRQQRDPAQAVDREARDRPARRRRRRHRSARGCGRGSPDAPGRWRRRASGAGRAVPLSPAIRYMTAVRGSATLWTGWPSPGTSLRASR